VALAGAEWLVGVSPMFCKTSEACGDMDIKEGATCKDRSITIPEVAVFACDTVVDTSVLVGGLVPITEQAD